jgi:hypothetical protein
MDLGAKGGAAAQLFARRVARTPGDLLSHVRRIYLHIAEQQPDAVYGALLDLFVVLGEKGRPLRERMLQAARALLRADQETALAQGITRGLAATDNFPPSVYSRFATHCTQNARLIERVQAAHSALHDPLRQAREHLEYGQVEEACGVLEVAFLQEPERQALLEELVEVYRGMRCHDRLAQMLGRLGQAGAPLPAALLDLAGHFGIQVPA